MTPTARKHFGRAATFALGGTCLALLLGPLPRAVATWSIIIIDVETGEIAIGSATCLTGFDLEAELPVVIVDVGAAAAQSLVDFDAINRMVIHEELLAGTRPDRIVEILADRDTAHESRQYGVVDVGGCATTFTGGNTSDFAAGVIGQAGSLVYAIQGNILTSELVITMAEQAVLMTQGDLPEKLMAAMEAARAMGGDGRCSCSRPFDLAPTGCGSPPILSFDKSADVGFMIVARTGDHDGVCDALSGCANGDYFMNLNIAGQSIADLDPVVQLREQFDAWRSGLDGRVDAVQSTATLEPASVLADQVSAATLTLALRDWQSTLVSDASLTLRVEHAANSAGSSTIGPVVSEGDGVYRVELVTGLSFGSDIFLVTVEDPVRPVILLPRPTLQLIALTDFDRDGDVDLGDAADAIACLGGPAMAVSSECVQTDVVGDGRVDLRDIHRLQADYTGPACVELAIVEQPEPPFVVCGLPFILSVSVVADPPATFQWSLDGVPVPGETESVLAVPVADSSTLGLYHVQVTNTCGTAVSEGALVETRNFCP